jgi:superfamily II DNA or RNA helicase
MKAILSNRLYVPTDLVDHQMRQAYTYLLTYFEGSDDEYSEEILAFKEFDGYTGFHRGNLQKMNHHFGHLEIDDQRAICPMDLGLAFIDGIALYTEQLSVAKTWTRAETGIVRAPTGWGKTILSLGIVMRTKQRTLVLADRIKLLEQWEAETREKTNINELERAAGHPLIGQWTKREPYDLITFATFQGFFSKGGQKVLDEYRDHFGLTIAEEADTLPAECVSGVFSRFNPFFRLGISADEERKDMMHLLAYEIVGPVVAEGVTQTWPCDVAFIPTGITIPSGKYYQFPYGYTRVLQFLCKQEDRNDMICSQIKADVDAGYKCLVMTEFRDHVTKLEAMLKSRGVEARGTMGGDLGFDKLKEEAKAGDIDVVIATSKLVQRGTDVPRWDCLHLVLPSNNKQLSKQRSGRVRRPHKDKKKPAIIRDYIDNGHFFAKSSKATRKKTYETLDFEITEWPYPDENGMRRWSSGS